MPTLSAEKLNEFAIELLAGGGLDRQEAAVVAGSLVDANLRGYDSHGVMRIPSYLDRLRAGEIVPGAKFEVLKEGPSLLSVDGHWGFGQTQARRLTERLIEKAANTGIGVGTMIHSGHIGRLGEYCETVVAAGLAAILMVNNHGAVYRVAPPGGKAPRLSTNPIAIGIPHGDEPIVMDFGTCAVAEGKVRVLRIAGEKCPNGWILDNQGHPSNDPNDIYTDPPGTILPMGGDQTYKGFGLSLAVEILAGALSGGVCARDVPINQIGNCVFMIVLAPEYFGGADNFADEVTRLIGFVRSCPRVEGVDEIILPGDPERRTLAQKTAEGIYLDEGNWAELTKLADQLGGAVPG